MSTNEKPDRRAEERSHLARFLDSLPGAPTGIREFGDKPDLVIHTPTHRLGIEHTQLLQIEGSWGEPFPKEAESLESQCVEMARQLFEAEGRPPLYVNVCFNQRRIHKPDIQGIAERLAVVVERNAPTEPREQCKVEAWCYNRKEPGSMPEQVERLWITKPHRDDVNSGWGVDRASVVPQLTWNRLQVEIDKKNAKRAEYKKRCDELWLLLVADGFSPATSLSLPEGFAETFTFGFDRVFYFHNFSQVVVELARTGGATPTNLSEDGA